MKTFFKNDMLSTLRRFFLRNWNKEKNKIQNRTNLHKKSKNKNVKLFPLAPMIAITCLYSYKKARKDNFEYSLTESFDRNFIANAVENSASSVVNITISSGYQNSTGSGFIISEDGLIVTNAHVVAHCNKFSNITITLSDGSQYEGIIHSIDTISDLALVQLIQNDIKENNKIKLPTSTFGSSSDLRAGEWVIALGSPLSLQNSVSAGIVSAVARHSSELGFSQKSAEYIQTDAAINIGNSGGPLVNLDGHVIGVNVMKVAGGSGISFAIPIDTAIAVINQLKKNKKVIRPYLGMQMISFNASHPSRFYYEFSKIYPNIKNGVVVKAVTPLSPAEKGGLLPGDLIVGFENIPVQSTKDILTKIGFDVGKKFSVKVLRDGKKEPITLYFIAEALKENKYNSYRL